MNHRRSSHGRGFLLLIALASCALLTGCVGATPMPDRVRGPSGSQIEKGELDMTFLESSPVHREDVASKLAPIDTGYRDPHLFWGRWVDSKWGYWWVVVAAGPGSPAAGAGDAKRIWHVKNLLVTFDDDGLMQKREVIDDEHTFWRTLHTHVTQMPPLDISQPEYLVLDNPIPQSILLHKDYFEVTGFKKGPARISPTLVARLTHEASQNNRDRAGLTCHTLHFSEKTAIGRKFTVCGSAQKIMTLFEYLQEMGPKTMRWE